MLCLGDVQGCQCLLFAVPVDDGSDLSCSRKLLGCKYFSNTCQYLKLHIFSVSHTHSDAEAVSEQALENNSSIYDVSRSTVYLESCISLSP